MTTAAPSGIIMCTIYVYQQMNSWIHLFPDEGILVEYC